MQITSGSLVVRKNGSKEPGQVQIVKPSKMAVVVFPSGTVSIHIDDLEVREVESHDSSLRLGKVDTEILRERASYLSHAHRYDPRSSISSARIDPMPHQIFATYRATKKVAPTMLLADEVGLGKTIEAALILKELRARKLVERVLILAPASLTIQWQGELSGKFNENFEVFDGNAVKHFGRGNKNAWQERDLVIASLPFASGKRQSEDIIAAGWDFIIVDEAHKVRRQKIGNSYKETAAYTLVNELKDLSSSRGLLLLTATPMQLNEYELYSLIELIEPGLYPTFNSYLEVSQTLPQMNDMMREYLKWPHMNKTHRQKFLTKHSRFLLTLGMVPPSIEVDDIEDELDILAQKHPLSEVMIRNRKKELDIGSERIARRFPVKQSPQELEIYEEVETYLRYGHNLAEKEKKNAIGFLMAQYYRMLTSSSSSLRISMQIRAENLKSQLGKERQTSRAAQKSIEELEDPLEATDLEAIVTQSLGTQEEIKKEILWLEDLANKLGLIRDTKAQVLLDILEEINDNEPGAKVLIFTQFTRTQSFLLDVLEKQHGYDVAIFNGKLKVDEKEREITRFKNKAQILISTEAGGEGRNLQFSHYLINYDLPWNPMKVEQRIGRLDRIGQKHPVVIYNLAYEDTIEDRVLELLTDRIGIFEKSVGSLDPILGDVESNIREAVFKDVKAAKHQFSQLSQDLESQVLNARASEAKREDLMMDRMSLRRDYVNRILEKDPLADHNVLKDLVLNSLPEIGGEIHVHPDGGYQAVLSRELKIELQIAAGRVHGFFDPNFSSENGEMEFFAFGNRFIDGIMDKMLRIPYSGVGGRVANDVKSGDHLEVVYQFRFGGVRPSAKIVRFIVQEAGSVVLEEDKKIDLSGTSIEIDVPHWANSRFAEIESIVEKMQVDFRNESLAEFDGIQREEKLRASRVFDQLRIRNQESLDTEMIWWNANKDSEDPKVQKVLPARKGRITKLEKRISSVELELESAISIIEMKVPEIEFERMWISMVRGAQ